MDDNSTIIGGLVASLISAIAWLGKKLYDAPRKEDYEAVKKERDDLRKIVDAAADEVRSLSRERDEENRKLRDEIALLRMGVERRASGGGEHVLARKQPRQPLRRRGHPDQDERNPRDPAAPERNR